MAASSKDDKGQSTTRLNTLLAVQSAVQAEWEAAKYWEVDPPAEDDSSRPDKFFACFPYPYANGRLHVGHTFTITKAEFAAKFQRQLGKRVLFPFSFHCTGMPIKACADKLAREMELYGTPPQFPTDEPPPASGAKAKTKDVQKGNVARQWTVMQRMGLDDADIPRFADTAAWLAHFPPLVAEDVAALGCSVDWRRSFITTDANPYYDSFIRWQFRTLKELGKIHFGKRNTVYSAKDGQPCMDHDRSSGEGVGPQEYAGIKARLLPPYPGALAAVDESRPIYLVAATLRAETMYGQTNVFVLPDGEYTAWAPGGDASAGEVWVTSARAARNMAHQEITAEFGTVTLAVDAPVLGHTLLGARVVAPLSPVVRFS